VWGKLMKKLTWVFTAAGMLLSVASLARLMQGGFHIGSFVAPIQSALDFDRAFLTLLLGWTEPYLQKLPPQWHPYPHWKDLFVVFFLYVIAVIRGELSLVRWNVETGTYVRPIRTVWPALLVGPVVAFGYSVAVGSTPIDIDYANDDLNLLGFSWSYRILVLGMLVFAFVLLDLIVHPEVRVRALRWLVLGSTAIIVIGLATQAALLLILLALFVWMAIYSAVLAAERAYPFGMPRSALSKKFWVNLRREANISFAIMGALGGAAALVLANAGLRFAGL
jgi:hypothetical protein